MHSQEINGALTTRVQLADLRSPGKVR